MIRFLFRMIGLLCLASGFVFLVYDGTKSIAADMLIYTRVSDFWTMVHATSLQQLEPYMKQHGLASLWDPVMVPILGAPACVAFGIAGAIFLILGRRKKPLIGYAR